jgi:hypothetical protein
MPGSTLGGSSHTGVGFSLDLLKWESCTDALCVFAGWGKYMEWMYPVDVEITNKGAFRAAGAVAAATL